MKVPVGIDLRRASFTLCQFREKVGFTKRTGFGSGVRRSSGPIIPFQIIARASVARGNRDWDRAAIVSRSCFLMGVSLSPLNSSFIMQTSRKTCTASISGKLRHNSEHLQVAREKGRLTKRRKWRIPRTQYRSAPGFHGYMLQLVA